MDVAIDAICGRMDDSAPSLKSLFTQLDRDTATLLCTSGSIVLRLRNLRTGETAPSGYSQQITLSSGTPSSPRQAMFYALARALHCVLPNSIFLEDWARVGIHVLCAPSDVNRHTRTLADLLNPVHQEDEDTSELHVRTALLDIQADWTPSASTTESANGLRQHFQS